MTDTVYRKEARARKNKIRAFMTWMVVGAILLFSSIVYLIVQGEQRDNILTEQDVTISNLATALSDQQQQFKDCIEHTAETPIEGCEEPVADSADKIVEDTQKAETPTVKGATGERGPGPTLAQTFSGVQMHCAFYNNCVGEDGQTIIGPDGVPGLNGSKGDKGDKGDSPTNADVMAIVQECFSTGACVAPQGPVGADGATGAPGAPGANATDEQVAAAVAAWCAANSCSAPPPVEEPVPVP